MKINKLDRFETKPESEISPEQDKQNREMIVNLLVPIVEKIQNLSPVPVSSSFADLMNELKNGVKRQPVIIQSGESEKPADDTESLLKNVALDDTESLLKFDKAELEILEKLKNEISER